MHWIKERLQDRRRQDLDLYHNFGNSYFTSHNYVVFFLGGVDKILKILQLSNFIVVVETIYEIRNNVYFRELIKHGFYV